MPFACSLVGDLRAPTVVWFATTQNNEGVATESHPYKIIPQELAGDTCEDARVVLDLAWLTTSELQFERYLLLRC